MEGLDLLAGETPLKDYGLVGLLVQAERGGRLSNQGLAFSNCPANLNKAASSPKGPMNWTPQGSPSGVQ